MGFCNNTILFVLLFMLNTSLMNHIRICIAFDQELCIPSERQALLHFKHHLLNPLNRLASWSENTNCCNWTSVVCSNVSGHILQLHLRTSRSDYVEYETYGRSQFGGEIDPSILSLNYLSYLDLSGNDFGGMQIPSFLGSMTSLTYLNLSYAGFSGSIPHQIGNISNLLHLGLGGNHFIGKIPHQIGNLSNLLYLCLNGGYRYDDMNMISLYVENLQWMSSLSSLQYLELGFVNLSNSFEWFHALQSLPSLTKLHLPSCALPHHFPPAISFNFSSLAVLSLSDNSFGYSSYFISKWISQLKNLVSLQLNYNDLQGSILIGIQNLTLLEELDLSYNLFNSSIPDWLYTLTYLKSLSLSGNNLQGPISYAIGNLTSLVTLDLSGNDQLEGPIPSSLSSLCNLRRVDFSSIKLNQQVSEIIEIISNCASHTLQALSILSAQLSGNLTPQIGIFKNLVSLELGFNPIGHFSLSRNSIDGVIPISLGNLSSLNHLDLSENSIHGAIPVSLGNLSSLNHLDLSGNQFKGNPFDAIQSLSALQSLDINENLFQGEVTEDHLANFTELYSFTASRNKLILKVGVNWNPSFQKLKYLNMESWNLGPHFPSWMKSLRCLQKLFIPNTNISDSLPTWLWDAFPDAYIIDFSNNNIHGDLSHTIKNPINVSYIVLSSNHLSGPLPHISPNVAFLDLSNNSFSGSLDSFLCQGKVTQMGLRDLILESNNLSGEIPDCWIMWPNLKFVMFSDNNIHGDLSHTIKNLINVSSIDLSSNHLSGPLPHISPNVVSMDLSNNSFSGSLDSFLCQGKVTPMRLGDLNLESNNLSGKIPDCWIMWPNLVFIKFDSNNLSGNLPQSLGSLPWLRSLQLRNNALFGNFPICLKNITGLVFLDLSENQFSGVIPLWVGYNLLNLKVFLLRSNKFSSSIPNQICCLNSLQVLDLGENNLTGQIPKCISNMTAMLIMNTSLESYILAQGNLTLYSITEVLLALKGRLDDYHSVGLIMSIDLSDNKLSGEIPSQITSLAGLQFLNLSNNLLHGKIPQSIGNMGSLQSIDFSENKLSGEIPPSISKLNFLNKLNLSHNNLIGKIPTGTQLQSFEANSFVGNDLCGPPLPNKCNDPNHVTKHEHTAKKGKGRINWFYVSMSMGFVFGFWAVVGPLLYSRSWRYTYFWFLDYMWYKIQSFWC